MNMKAKILCVYEEGSIVNTPLIGANGASMLISADDQLTLFDTGMRESYLLKNMRHLGVNVNDIDRIVLSNGTRPHTGGLNGILKEREHSVKVYGHKDIWQPSATAVKGFNIKKTTAPKVLDENAEKADMFQISGKIELSENLTAFTLPPAEPNERYKRAVDGFWVNDTFHDETALILTTKKGPVLMTGCCRTSIFNALKAVKDITGKEAIAVVGNIFSENKKKDPEVERMALSLANDIKTPILYLGYCTSPGTKTAMRTKLGLEGVKDWYVGTELQFDMNEHVGSL